MNLDYVQQYHQLLGTTLFKEKTFSFGITIEEETSNLKIALLFEEYQNGSRELTCFKIQTLSQIASKDEGIKGKMLSGIIYWVDEAFKEASEKEKTKAVGSMFKIVWEYIKAMGLS